MAAAGISDDELLKRLGAIYTEAYVAGVAEELAEYRWRSYGEAVGGGPKGNGKKARAGLVRACMGRASKRRNGRRFRGFAVGRWVGLWRGRRAVQERKWRLKAEVRMIRAG